MGKRTETVTKEKSVKFVKIVGRVSDPLLIKVSQLKKISKLALPVNNGKD